MKETARAREAFTDYYGLGPKRSLRKLHQQYCLQTVAKPPTVRLNTLALWSKEHGWQERVLQRNQEIAEVHFEAIKNKAIESGYAFWPKRVLDLGQLAERLNGLVSIPGLFSPALVREYRGLLGDIAAEMGERVKGIALSGPDGGPIDINFGATARDTLLGRLLSSASSQDEGRTDKTING